MYWYHHPAIKDCFLCAKLEERLGKFIGKKMVKAIKASVKRNP